MSYDPELIAKLRKESVNKLAEEIASVQPMPSDLFQRLYEASKSVEELEREGYKPVSKLGLMYIKE